MDAVKMGEFISILRKEKGLTQTELAEKLNISNRTVSKWENGDGYPDITILPELADIFEVSVDELLSGERKTVEISETPIIFEGVFTENKKGWIKALKCVIESASKQSFVHLAVLLLGMMVYYFAKTNLFKIEYPFIVNLYKGIGFFFIATAFMIMLLPLYTAFSHLRSVKLRYGEIPRQRLVFSDKIYIEMGDDARGRMYYRYEDITKFIINEEVYVIVFNKKVYLYLPRNAIQTEKQVEFERLIASYSKDVYDTSLRKKLNKAFKIFYIALIIVSLVVFAFHQYSTSQKLFYTNLYEKRQYYYDNKAEFSRGLENVKNDELIQKEVKDEGSAVYYAETYINLDQISDVEITSRSVCFDSYFDSEKIYSGYIYYEGEGIPTPKNMNFEEGELDKEKPNYLEEENIYLIGKEKNGSLTKNEWFLVMPLENNWFYCEYH